VPLFFKLEHQRHFFTLISIFRSFLKYVVSFSVFLALFCFFPKHCISSQNRVENICNFLMDRQLSSLNGCLSSKKRRNWMKYKTNSCYSLAISFFRRTFFQRETNNKSISSCYTDWQDFSSKNFEGSLLVTLKDKTSSKSFTPTSACQ
jgi:hypothetical protein